MTRCFDMRETLTYPPQSGDKDVAGQAINMSWNTALPPLPASWYGKYTLVVPESWTRSALGQLFPFRPAQVRGCGRDPNCRRGWTPHRMSLAPRLTDLQRRRSSRIPDGNGLGSIIATRLFLAPPSRPGASGCAATA